MTTIKYDVSGVEPTVDQDFDTPIPKGVYKMRITDASYAPAKSSGVNQITLELEVPKGDFAGRKVWDYIQPENDAQEWKVRQLIDALGLKDRGSLVLEKIVGKTIQVRVRHDSQNIEEYGVRAKVGALLPKNSDAPDDEPEDEPEAEATADDGEEVEEELTAEDLQEMDREEMEELIEDNDLEDEVKFNKRTPDEKLRDRIAEALGIEEDDEAGDDDDDDGDDDDGDDEPEDYSDMSVADLKAELRERGLSPAGPKKTLIRKLKKNDAEDDGEPF
jgi:hypothetical protein